MTLSDLAQLSLLAVAAGVVAAGAGGAVRAIPWPRPWLKVKPLGCPTCLGFWSSLVTVGFALAMGAAPELGLARDVGAGVALLGASTAIASQLLHKLFPPPFSDRFDDEPPPAAPAP